MEKEAQKSQANAFSMMTEKIDGLGKDIIEYPPKPEPSSTLNALMR